MELLTLIVILFVFPCYFIITEKYRIVNMDIFKLF